jgi:hypothetical protein
LFLLRAHKKIHSSSRMAKSCRKGSKRMRNRTKRRRQQKNKRGGGLLEGASYNSSLSGSSASKMSLAQGGDYLSYHEGQHGGVADYARAFDTMTDPQMISSSMSEGQLRAITQMQGLRDDAPPALGPTPASPGTTNGAPACGSMLGGRRRRSKKNKRGKKSKKSKKQRRRRQGGGGPLGYAPVGAPGLLLDSNRAYTQAGLNPEYYQSSSTEQLVADMRDRA